MTRAVSLAMYDPDEGAVGRLWSDLRPVLGDAGFADLPAELQTPANFEAAWLDPDLLLAQTCGYPLKHALGGKVRYLGTPVYAVDGTDGPYYRSALVVRADDQTETLADLRGRRAAYNSTHSQSGYNALRDAASAYATDGRFFSAALETGSHAASLRAVIDNRADVAAIDPVTLAQQPASLRGAVRIIDWTDWAPGLPYIASLGTSDAEVSVLRDALRSFIEGPAMQHHPAFHLKGFEVLEEEAYDRILDMEQRAIDRAYPVLG